jgi:hypothetical protein
MRIGFCVLWLFAAAIGIALISIYQTTAGGAGATPQVWPRQSQIAFDSKRDTLIMFAHPHCSCTRASIEELNRVLAQNSGQVAAHVFFFKPEKFTRDWIQTDLWRSATAIPGVTVHEDLNGEQARQFGAETSGYVLLYDRHGQLLFKGGITGSRGHAGDNAGEETISAFLGGQKTGLKETPVYGCELMDKACSMPEAIK